MSWPVLMNYVHVICSRRYVSIVDYNTMQLGELIPIHCQRNNEKLDISAG